MKTSPLPKNIPGQARYIMERGKKLHDHVARIYVGHFSGIRKKNLDDLSATQLHAIKAIWKQESVGITELAGLLRISPPSASALVDRMEERGILIRERSKEDRRKVEVRISETVKDDVKKIEDKILNAFIDLVERIGPEAARKWCEVLDRVQEVLEENP